MSVDQAISDAVSNFDKAIIHLSEEFSRLQVGRASTGLVENIMVEIYGVSQPMKAIASISIPEARTIQMQPWDKSALAHIEKAISNAGLGLNPINDGVLVRINIPQLTQERRVELSKIVKKFTEEAKITGRNIRQEAHNAFKKLRADSVITEDEVHGADKRLQDKVDDFNKRVDDTAALKEKDIMTI